ncbi:MAG: glycosyltransferase family 4 protein [Chitinophagaceae bacterium]
MSDKRLIAIFCSTFPPEVSGASGRIYNLAVLLREAGFEVQIVCAMPNYPVGKVFTSYRGKMIVDEVLDGISVRRVALFPSNVSTPLIRAFSLSSFVLSLRIFAYRWLLRKSPVLVIVSSPPLPMAADVIRFFKKKNKQVLLNVSDIWPLSASALGAVSDGKLYQAMQRREQKMYAQADAITAQSESTLTHIKAALRQAKPLMLYRNLPALIPELSEPETIPEMRLIYPGVLGHAQGLLEFCKHIDLKSLGIGLDIFGGGPELLSIKKWIQQHPDCGVQLFDSVSPSELPALLRRYRAMLINLNTDIEGAVPSKLFTAIAASIPVVFNAGKEGTEIVEKWGLGWTANPGDFKTISQNIRALKEQPDKAFIEMRNRINQASTQAFNKKIQDAGMLEFVRNILS